MPDISLMKKYTCMDQNIERGRINGLDLSTAVDFSGLFDDGECYLYNYSGWHEFYIRTCSRTYLI